MNVGVRKVAVSGGVESKRIVDEAVSMRGLRGGGFGTGPLFAKVHHPSSTAMGRSLYIPQLTQCQGLITLLALRNDSSTVRLQSCIEPRWC